MTAGDVKTDDANTGDMDAAVQPPGDAQRAGRVLLVEDNPADARLTIEAFRESGAAHLLTAVEDAYEALAILRQEGCHAGAPRPDLILLDLNLPRMHGREFLAIVKSEPRFKRIPVIVLSTSQSPEDVRAAYDLRANCYISKPMNLDELVGVARQVVQFWLTTARLSAD